METDVPYRVRTLGLGGRGSLAKTISVNPRDNPRGGLLTPDIQQLALDGTKVHPGFLPKCL